MDAAKKWRDQNWEAEHIVRVNCEAGRAYALIVDSKNNIAVVLNNSPHLSQHPIPPGTFIELAHAGTDEDLDSEKTWNIVGDPVFMQD